MHPYNNWTVERVALLRKLWSEGLSASQVAKQLGGVSRNAVIGKAHRLGLLARAKPTRPVRMPRVRAPRSPQPTARLISTGGGEVYVCSNEDPRERQVAVARSAREHEAALARSLSLQPLVGADGRTTDVHRLMPTMCKFPIGDPSDSAFGFCGRPVDGARCYCAPHAALCYPSTPTAKRSRRLSASSVRDDKLSQYMVAGR